MAPFPVRLAVVLPSSELSAAGVRHQLDIARLADDLWVDEVIVCDGRGPDPLTLLGAIGQSTSTIRLTAGVPATLGVAAGDALGRRVATAQAMSKGRLGVVVLDAASEPGPAADALEAARAGLGTQARVYVEGPPVPDVAQLAIRSADGWQFPAGIDLDQIHDAGTAASGRRRESGWARPLQIRTHLSPAATADFDGVWWDLDAVTAHAAAGSSVVIADLEIARREGADPRLALTELSERFLDLHPA